MSRLSFLCSAQTGAGWMWEVAETGHCQDSWHKLTKGAFHTILHCAQAIKVKKVGYWLLCLSSYFVCWGAAFLEVGEHLPVNGKQWINFSIWLYLHAWFLSFLSNCHYFDWWGFLFSFSSSPYALGQEDMSERKNDWLPSGLNPQQYLRWNFGKI